LRPVRRISDSTVPAEARPGIDFQPLAACTFRSAPGTRRPRDPRRRRPRARYVAHLSGPQPRHPHTLRPPRATLRPPRRERWYRSPPRSCDLSLPALHRLTSPLGHLLELVAEEVFGPVPD